MQVNLQAQAIVLTERPLIDVPTSMLVTIKNNLTKLLKEEVVAENPILADIVRLAWTEELKGVTREMILRS